MIAQAATERISNVGRVGLPEIIKRAHDGDCRSDSSECNEWTASCEAADDLLR